jgi:S1-C subfamily serine protease
MSAEGFGITLRRIGGTTPRSPAEAAKLQPGDVILEFNHVPIKDDGQLVNVDSMTEVGLKVPVLIFRNRQTLTAQIQVQDRTKYPP